ncbi:MAG: 50S ribosome-binding GTPase [Kiritimatiellae bacterium]|nr:50S ribosome-binding GTPase [Kiritimatiellia bacterium]
MIAPGATLEQPVRRCVSRVVLLGNPNAGKTSLFNMLSGLRAKTANFPGTTVSHRMAKLETAGRTVHLIDLPGLYSLQPTTPEERVAAGAFKGDSSIGPKPDGAILVVDATNLERNLFLVSQALEHDTPDRSRAQHD